MKINLVNILMKLMKNVTFVDLSKNIGDIELIKIFRYILKKAIMLVEIQIVSVKDLLRLRPEMNMKIIWYTLLNFTFRIENMVMGQAIWL